MSLPGAGRLGDVAQVPSDSHGCPHCPHPGVGPAIVGSANVNVNGMAALRVGDAGVHSACCSSNTWVAVQGAPTVFVNGRAAFRMGDATAHCGGNGRLVAGSGNVIIGSAGGAGILGALGGLGGMLSLASSVGGVVAGALGLPANVVGLIANADKIIDVISDFRHGWKAGLASLIGAAAELGLSFGLGKLVGLLDHALSGLGTLLKEVLWIFGRYIPGLKDVLRNVHAYLQLLANFLLNVIGALPGEGACHPRQKTWRPSERTRKELTFNQAANDIWAALWASRMANPNKPTELITWDVSRLAGRLLRAFRPVFVEHPTDLRALSIEDLLAHSTLTPAPPNGEANPATLQGYYEAVVSYGAALSVPNPVASLDIEEQYARGRIPDRKSVV